MPRGNFIKSRKEDMKTLARQMKLGEALDHLKNQLDLNRKHRERLKNELQETEDIIRETKEVMNELMEERG